MSGILKWRSAGKLMSLASSSYASFAMKLSPFTLLKVDLVNRFSLEVKSGQGLTCKTVQQIPSFSVHRDGHWLASKERST